LKKIAEKNIFIDIVEQQ